MSKTSRRASRSTRRVLGRPAVELLADLRHAARRAGRDARPVAARRRRPAGGRAGGGEIAFTVESEAAVAETIARWQALRRTNRQAADADGFRLHRLALDPDGHRLRVFAPAMTRDAPRRPASLGRGRGKSGRYAPQILSLFRERRRRDEAGAEGHIGRRRQAATRLAPLRFARFASDCAVPMRSFVLTIFVQQGRPHPLPPPEQPLDVGQLQFDVGRAAVVALAGAGRRLHFAQQRVHLLGLELAARRAPSGGRRSSPGDGRACARASARRPRRRGLRRDRAPARPCRRRRAAPALRAAAPRRGRSGSTTRPSASSSAARSISAAAARGSRSTTSGLSRICRAMPLCSRWRFSFS